MAVKLVVFAATLALAAGARRKAAAVPDPNCIVTSTSVDGTEESRDCFMVSAAEQQPGTKGRFESCTQ